MYIIYGEFLKQYFLTHLRINNAFKTLQIYLRFTENIEVCCTDVDEQHLDLKEKNLAIGSHDHAGFPHVQR